MGVIDLGLILKYGGSLLVLLIIIYCFVQGFRQNSAEHGVNIHQNKFNNPNGMMNNQMPMNQQQMMNNQQMRPPMGMNPQQQMMNQQMRPPMGMGMTNQNSMNQQMRPPMGMNQQNGMMNNQNMYNNNNNGMGV